MKLIMSIIGACAILMVINGCGCESDDEVVALDDTTQEEVVAFLPIASYKYLSYEVRYASVSFH